MEITKENILKLTEERIASFDGFVVDLVVANGNKFTLELDTPKGISIGELEDVNRFLNKELDNETNEFELTVSSPGMERPFKVYKQYLKNLGRQIKVKTKDGKVTEGALANVNEKGITLNYKVKEAPEGKKKKEWVEKTAELLFENIAETKKIITFK
jgi:ribosome maturation factor RimP